MSFIENDEIYKRQWYFTIATLVAFLVSWNVLDGLWPALILGAGMIAMLGIKCPRCRKSIMQKYGRFSPRRRCPHCDWPGPEDDEAALSAKAELAAVDTPSGLN
jgi:hypothetical protein